MAHRKSNRPSLGMVCAGFFLLLAGSLQAESHVINVTHGNVLQLINALNDAAMRPPSDQTVIVMSGRFNLLPVNVLPEIQTRVVLRGGNSAATIAAKDGLVGTLLEIDDAATLNIENLEFADIRLPVDGLISNRGNLEISRVQFSRVRGTFACVRFCWEEAGPVITNEESGTLHLDEVSFVNSGITGFPLFHWSFQEFGALLTNHGEAELRNVQAYLADRVAATPLDSSGSLILTNVSLYARGATGENHLGFSLFGPAKGTTTIANSIISGFSAEWCEDAQSRGHNLIDNPDCGFDAPGDVIGAPADLIWAPVEANWNADGREILTHALVPIASSIAVDSADPALCEPGSLLDPLGSELDGDGDGISGCDRGAVERVPTTLGNGGVNGLFYNPNADGHYVFVAETTYNTMVIWTTFDAAGEQAWILGIGGKIRPNGRLVTDAYLSRDGAVRPSGKLDPAEVVPWGQLEIRMSSCNGGTLIFDSDLPGFGSGQFEIVRLAETDLLGCIEGP